MSLRVRRGLDADRLTIIPENGEPIWTTDTNKLYIGDGVTVGGIEVDIPIDGKLDLDGGNANTDIDIDTYSFNAKSLHVKGTGGTGHLGLKHQSGSITASASESSLGANSSGNPVWKNDGNPIQNIMLENAPITGATKTKITYDSKGVITSGADATTADINDSTNRRYVTDSEKTVIGNTSGTNTGNETASTLGATINGASSATPNDTDLVATVESSILKKITWTNIKSFLKTYFDSLYVTGPSGSNGEIQFNNSGAFGSATNATIVDEELTLIPVSSPNTPTSGLKLTSVNLAEKILLYTKDRDGVYSPVQSNMYMNSIYLMKAIGNSTNVTYIGGLSLTATGAAASSSVSVTNIHTQMKRVDFLITTPATNAVAGFRNGFGQYFRGSSSSEGGFFFVGRWGPATGVSTATNQACFGMHGDQTAPSNASPITVLNQISMGWESADANIQIMHNDGTGNASKIDLGASFPVPTADRTKVYELVLFCKPGGSDVYYRVMDLGTGSVATGTINSDLPSATTLMHAKGWMSAGGTSSVIGMAVMSIYIETFN